MLTTTTTHTLAREKVLERDVTALVEQRLDGVEVLAVELVSPGRFCVYVDHPDGVGFDLCERVTHLLDDYRSDYGIDVSSPGPDRPLRRSHQFRRAVGREVALKTTWGGRKRMRAEVLGATDAAVAVRAAGRDLDIPYDEIVRANLIDEERKEP
jgi:ribosome maturation factor RimP